MKKDLPPKHATEEEVYKNEITRLGLPNDASWDEIKRANIVALIKKSKALDIMFPKNLSLSENATYEEIEKAGLEKYRKMKVEEFGLSKNVTWKKIIDVDLKNPRELHTPIIEYLVAYLDLSRTANRDDVEKELKKRGLA